MNFERIMSPEHPAFERVCGLYQISFPLHEQRTRETQEAVLTNPEYHCQAIFEEDLFVGLLMAWETPDFIYVEHFAIAPELRGQNYGSQALKLLREQGKPVVLEIDPLVDEAAIRRKHFYEKIGFRQNPFDHVHPPYRANFQGHELVVMTYPEPWDREKYQRFAAYLTLTVMADCPSN